MAASAPTFPDVRTGVKELLKDRTDAGTRVSKQGEPGLRATRPPRIIVEHAGAIEFLDRTQEEVRIFIHALGQTVDGTWRLAYQIRDVMLPVNNGPWGVNASVQYQDEEGNTRVVQFTGARLESGPRAAPESETRVITNYLVSYH